MEAKEKEAEELRQRAIEREVARGATTATADAETSLPSATTAPTAILPKHARKKAIVFEAYDLSVDKPCCILPSIKDSTQTCGHVPAASGGTANYWSHLHREHRAEWLRLKRKSGMLTDVGEEQLQALQSSFNKTREKSATSATKATLSAEGKEVLDRLCAEWIVDDDGDYCDANTDAHRKLMSAATEGAYEGCCEQTVKGHMTQMAAEGVSKAKREHEGVLADGIKLTKSGDLWSKNGMTLFGTLSHFILHKEREDTKPWKKWVMIERLTGAIPCSDVHHTGEYIASVSALEWQKVVITSAIDQVFVAKSDRGSNMLKGWEDYFQAPCCDHLLETDLKAYLSEPRIQTMLAKGRGQVGYLHSSTIGHSDFNGCQRQLGMIEKLPPQDVCTRWRSTFMMTDGLRDTQDGVLLFDI